MANSFWKLLTSLKVTVVLLVFCVVLVFLGTLAQVHEGLWEAQTRWFKSFWVWRSGSDVWWVPPVFPGGYTLGFALLFNLLAAHLKRFRFTWDKAGIHLTHFGVILLLAGQLFTDLFSRESFIQFAEGESRNYSEAHRETELVVNISAPEAPGKDRVISYSEAALRAQQPLRHPELPFELKIVEYGENAEVIAHDNVREAGTRLLTALATLDSSYSTAEALVVQAEKASENPGRVAIWTAALKGAGEARVEDLVGAVKKVVADPAREAAFREDLKKRFRSQMLGAFQKMPKQGSQARAMAYVAAETEVGRSINLEQLPAAATHGAGPRMILRPMPVSRGMDDQNVPYAKVEVLEKGSSLGTWILSAWLNPQEVTVAGKLYRLAMRNERYFQPFTLTLLRTTHEVYEGTRTATNPSGIPRNFQSRVRIENPATQERREVDISMNNPLRYGGLTFYQSQMSRTEESGGKGVSGLQVVRNPGWLTPYLGCVIVALGMTWQFMHHLVGFLSRPRTARNEARSPGGASTESNSQP